MGAITRAIGGSPLVFQPQLAGQPQLQPQIFVTGPAGDVAGFVFDAVEEPTQEQVDGLSAKFQSFYNGLTPAERVVMAAILAQAADYVEQMWPEEYAEAVGG